ncbi:MAG: PIN domain-containing protein [Caldilineaceae bacterium]|nr:PIN domain-containing protein [Caldilineaceae bacterium]
MALYDLADPETLLPAQLVLDTSLLLACRTGDDNPNATATQNFVARLGQQIAAYQTIAWLLTPVIQECYHIILSRALRRAWENQQPQSRPPNWLAAYKHEPHLLATGFAEMIEFDEILASIPLTPAQPSDLTSAATPHPLDERMRHFITTYHLLPQDALILAEAEKLGVSAMATLDRDWQRVAEFDIYTILNAR